MKNFTKNDEEFICENCGAKVNPLGYSSRDHCPHCLCSKHVDINPGDREAECKGLLKPIQVLPDSKKGYIIIYRCTKCGEERRCKAASDDDLDLLIKYTVNF